MKTMVLGTVLVGLLVTIVAGALPDGRERRRAAADRRRFARARRATA